MNRMILMLNLLFLYNIFLSCRQANTQSNSDTAITNIDTANSKNRKNNPTEDTTGLRKIIQDYEAGYDDSSKIDTSFLSKGKKVEVIFNHYCLYDSSIKIPSKYISYLGIEKYITHNFESNLSIKVNGSIVTDTTIRKQIFSNTLFYELKEYGVLLFPNLSFDDDHILIDYSISIPLTDVGTQVSVFCDLKGGIKVK